MANAKIKGDTTTTGPAKAGAAGPLCWLHLSDLHFRAERRWDRRKVLTSLLDFLRNDADDNGPRPQFVVLTGDIANAGQVEEYERAEDFLRTLMETLGLDPEEHLFLVPGNHDVDRTAIRSDRFTVNGVRQEETQDAIEDLLSSDDAMRQLAPRLAAFYDFTRRLLGPGRAWQPGRPWRADILDVAGRTPGILQLDSAWASGEDGEDVERKLLVGECQVREAMAELPPDAHPRIALMHHPLTALAGFDATPVGRILSRSDGVDVLLRGHLHDEDVAVVQRPSGQTIELAAGATYVEGGLAQGLPAGRAGRRCWQPDNAFPVVLGWRCRALDAQWKPLPRSVRRDLETGVAGLDRQTGVEADPQGRPGRSPARLVQALLHSRRGQSRQRELPGPSATQQAAGERPRAGPVRPPHRRAAGAGGARQHHGLRPGEGPGRPTPR